MPENHSLKKVLGHCVARPERFELPTPWFVAMYSDPAELRAQTMYDKYSERNYTIGLVSCQKMIQ